MLTESRELVFKTTVLCCKRMQTCSFLLNGSGFDRLLVVKINEGVPHFNGSLLNESIFHQICREARKGITGSQFFEEFICIIIHLHKSNLVMERKRMVEIKKKNKFSCWSLDQVICHYFEQLGANATLQWLHCSEKQKVSFVFHSTKDLQRKCCAYLFFQNQRANQWKNLRTMFLK